MVNFSTLSALMVKGSRNRLKKLAVFPPEGTGVLQDEDSNWSRSHSTYGYSLLLLSLKYL